MPDHEATEKPAEQVQASESRSGTESDSLTQSETLRLYGLMAGRCAKCRRPVVKESETSGKAYNLGKRAHVVGRSEDGPRGDSTVPKRERGDLRNHLLLCGTCHDEVDLDVEAWPNERLLELRATHLVWVGQLDEEPAVDHERMVYAGAIDSACELVWIDAWQQWTHNMLDPPLSWTPAQVEAVGEFAVRMNTSDWPGTLPELEVALMRLSHLLNEAAHTFSARAELLGDGDLRAVRAYKRGWNPNYHRDQQEFLDWLEYYEGLILEATMAGNWVRSAWRGAANPDFLADQRLFLVTGPHTDQRYRTHVAEYPADQKAVLLQAGRDGVRGVESIIFPNRVRDELDRVVGGIVESVFDEEVAFDVVEELSQRIRLLDQATDTGALFMGLPGRILPAEQAKRVTHELYLQGILRRNPDGRGFLLGEIPK